MSLYNMLFGKNPASPLLLAMLNIDSAKEYPEWPKDEEGEEVDAYGCNEETEIKICEYVQKCIEGKTFQSGRFRDIYLNEDGTEIILYTRNGGGNREGYWHIFDMLRKHPLYVRDYDDDFDCTYAYIVFKVPDDYSEICRMMATGQEPPTISEKFHREIESMEQMSAGQLREKHPEICAVIDKIADFASKPPEARHDGR